MNPFDLLAVVILVVGVIAGFRSGALPQIGGLVGAVAGGAVAILGLPTVLAALAGTDPVTRAVLVLGGLLACVAIGEALGSMAGRLMSSSLGPGFLGAVDQVAGAVVGLAQAVLVVWLTGGLVADAPLGRLATDAASSTAVRILNGTLPPPVAIASGLRRALDASGLPDVFVGLEPAPASPAPLPASPQARAIAALAQASTVKVSSPACGFQLTGSGVVIRHEYVVTNAHVVAGASSSRVSVGRELADARTVLFDPDLDVALLYVPGLDAPSLSIAADDPAPRSTGAALGYPGGGALTVIPAAVTRSIRAVGRDIYDQGEVSRDVLELHADIQRGDSGGPFVLPDGSVGGIVFAQSRTSEAVGYALSPVSVAERVDPALGRTASVDTGSCTS